MIKYKYIVQLIQAHFAGDEVRFLDRAKKVAKELEREGGRLQAQAILREVDFRLQVKIELPKENEDYIKSLKIKVDDDSFYLFLRNHKDLDENKVVIHYVDIEGRTVEVKLSELKWNWERMYLLLNFKIEHRINNENGDLVLYLEDLRER